jgi:hypothetical protein
VAPVALPWAAAARSTTITTRAESMEETMFSRPRTLDDVSDVV